MSPLDKEMSLKQNLTKQLKTTFAKVYLSPPGTIDE